MEIERKYLIDKNKIPFQPSDFPLQTDRTRLSLYRTGRQSTPGSGRLYPHLQIKRLMAREEYNLPLTKEAYLHLREKQTDV